VSGIQFGCPFCGAVAEVDVDCAGQEIHCPACEGPLVVPQPENPGPIEETPPSRQPSKKTAAPKTAGKPTKPKLWQTASRPDGRAPAAPSPELPQPVAPHGPEQDEDLISRLSPQDDPLRSLSDASLVDFDEPTAARPYGRRGSTLAREELARRRFVSNMVMLAASIVILFGVLAGLMYFNG
jgi:hypothetical protein